MADVKKFLFFDADGQLAEQKGTDTIQVANGVNALDAVNKSQLDSVSADLTDLINAEAARATQAEAALGGRIDTEIADRQSAVTSEETARIAGDAALRTDLDAEIANRISAVSAEQTARENADSNLQSQIDALSSSSSTALANAIASLTADLEAEEAARIAADAALQTELDAEEARAAAAEAAEQAARIAADNALQTEIDAEETRAAAAEAAIAADLAAEEARALAAEQDLADDIAAEQSRAQAAESTLTTNLAAEEARAIAREDEIEAALDAEIARATAAEAANLQEAKDYADAVAQGLSFKSSVDYAFERTAGGFTLPADAVAFSAANGLATGNRVLVYGAAHADCGIYVVQAGGAFARAADMAAGADAAGAYVYVESASDAGAAPGTAFVCANQGTATVGTAALEFVIFSRMENLSFSAGVQKVGTAVSLKVEAAKPVYVNGSNELTFRIGGADLGIDESGFLVVAGDLVSGDFGNADGRHGHSALTETMESAATVGVFVDSSGAAATYNAAAAYGCVDMKSGSNARVVIAGLSNVASGALNAFADDERVFLGSAAGVFCKFADIPSGKWAVPVGFKHGDKLKVHLMPAALKA